MCTYQNDILIFQTGLAVKTMEEIDDKAEKARLICKVDHS